MPSRSWKNAVIGMSQPAHRILYRDMEIPKAVLFRDKNSPPDGRLNVIQCDLELINETGHFSSRRNNDDTTRPNRSSIPGPVGLV